MHLLVCDTKWILKMHGATIKIKKKYIYWKVRSSVRNKFQGRYVITHRHVGMLADITNCRNKNGIWRILKKAHVAWLTQHKSCNRDRMINNSNLRPRHWRLSICEAARSRDCHRSLSLNTRVEERDGIKTSVCKKRKSCCKTHKRQF